MSNNLVRSPCPLWRPLIHLGGDGALQESSGNSVGFKDRWKYDGEAISRVGFDDDTFRTGFAWEGGLMGGGGGG